MIKSKAWQGQLSEPDHPSSCSCNVGDRDVDYDISSDWALNHPGTKKRSDEESSSSSASTEHGKSPHTAADVEGDFCCRWFNTEVLQPDPGVRSFIRMTSVPFFTSYFLLTLIPISPSIMSSCKRSQRSHYWWQMVKPG